MMSAFSGDSVRSVIHRLLSLVVIAFFAWPADAGEPREFLAGVASVDITPEYPVRLNGFGGRTRESQGVRRPIFAKALAVGTNDSNTIIIITIETLGVPDDLAERVAGRIEQQTGLSRSAIAFTATHTHSAPMIRNCANTLFGQPIADDQWKRILDYTESLESDLVQVGVDAYRHRVPSRLSWGQGRVAFAFNRRTKDGPVDHDLPVLAVRTLQGQLRAVFTTYACHCVTLSDDLINGDWAGYAAEHIARRNPECEALISIGCGADSNPRGGVLGDRADAAEALGIELAEEVHRVINSEMQPLTADPEVSFERIVLALAPLPDRDEWQRRAEQQNAIGYHAKVQLQRLDRGEPLTTEISWPVQSFHFGQELSLLFLPGEVVVDYSLRLKKELDADRLWISAYSNACPGYVPSERVLREGGYEGGGAMVYYDLPGPYATGLEQKIVDAAHRQLRSRIPGMASLDGTGTDGIRPPSPRRAVAGLRVPDGMRAELAAAEPAIESPVAINFGPDGSLWVAEMWDYPQSRPSSDAEGSLPGSSGRIRRLRDSNHDGHYEDSTVFLEGLPFPTGVTPWRDGVLICAAPDILFARDSDGDGSADSSERLFSGFATHNFQARVNSLEYGLDGWLYGSCGLFGGDIFCHKTGQTVKLGQRDFRCDPDSGLLEPATGSTQQGRVRNDWGDWFGCNNSAMLLHYPLDDQYLRRNPLLAPERTVSNLVASPAPGQLYPISSQVLFALSGPPGRATAACGLGIYRDNLLSPSLSGNALTCEPVNNLVHRQQLSPHGATFISRRPEDEVQREFIASDDPWFRPVQARTGIDGALWIVDMSRYVIEHPIWIPPDTLAKLDTRAGSELGRLYRIVPASTPARTMPDLTQLTGQALAHAMQTFNGPQRDLVQQQIVWTQDTATIPFLQTLALNSEIPEVRMQAACTLGCLNAISEETVLSLLSDAHPGVRRHAVRLSESMAAKSPALFQKLLRLANDEDPGIRLQLLYTAGTLSAEQSAALIVECNSTESLDSYFRNALESSLSEQNIQAVAGSMASKPKRQADWILGWEASLTPAEKIADRLTERIRMTRSNPDINHLRQLETFLAGLERRLQPVTLPDELKKEWTNLLDHIAAIVADDNVDEPARIQAIRILAYSPDSRTRFDHALVSNLHARSSPAIQSAVIKALSRSAQPDVARLLLDQWQTHPPALRHQIVSLLLEREHWTQILLEEVAAGRLSAAELQLSQQQSLLNHPREDIRTLASKAFQNQISHDRKPIVQRYVDNLPDSGNPETGQQLFQKHCSNCHRLQGIGHAVGPELANYSGKPVEALIIALMDPGQAVDPRYQAYVALLQDGRSLTGLVVEETATSLTLLAPEGRRETILRSDLEQLQSTGKSLMPVGFEQQVTVDDVASLWAWIRQQRPPAKALEGNHPEQILLTDSANGVLKASQAEIRGTDITFELPFQNIGYWHGVDDTVRWTLKSETDLDVVLWAEWACHPDSAGNSWQVEGAGQTISGKVNSTGGWDRYQLQRLGRWIVRAGESDLVLRPVGPLRGALADLRALHLVRSGGVPLATGMVAKQNPVSTARPPESPLEIARWLLNDQIPTADRETLARDPLEHAAEIIRHMAEGLPETSGGKEEYRRIPWIWRVAIATGKAGTDSQIRKLLNASLPQQDAKLTHWQAVVLGGGVINGMSLSGRWPRPEIALIIGEDRELIQRWQRALEQASQMADNEQVPTGTRYDALRMIALLDWSECRSQLQTCLKHTNQELQMGAVSALVDVSDPEATSWLIMEFGNLGEHNQSLALKGLLRSEDRCLALIQAISEGKLPASLKDNADVRGLRNHASETVRKAAQGL